MKVMIGDYKVGDLVRIKQGTHAAERTEPVRLKEDLS